ncbi:MAG: Uma2 family endonuclease [Synechococcales cyanobacterium M58_A2018_015]|nr:Uma2 family endonuclease [Synechococcales cyanobacterium M58_A2018_015]
MTAINQETRVDRADVSPQPEIVFPPSDLDSNEPPLETDFHRLQMTLLLQCLEWLWRDRNDFYASGNLTIYYSPNQLKSEDFRGPDFFVVLGTERKPRKSWVVWEEDGKYPNVIIELLSDSTAETDRGLKKQIYQDIFRTPEYFWFDPVTLELRGFALVQGQYQEMQPDQRGWLWSKQLQLFLGVESKQLRFFTADGELVLKPEEVARVELERASAAENRASAAEALLARYRERFGDLPDA